MDGKAQRQTTMMTELAPLDVENGSRGNSHPPAPSVRGIIDRIWKECLADKVRME